MTISLVGATIAVALIVFLVLHDVQRVRRHKAANEARLHQSVYPLNKIVPPVPAIPNQATPFAAGPEGDSPGGTA